MADLLKKNGLKVTRARLALLEAFIKSKSPLDARAIHQKLKKLKINEATVYRMLARLEGKGILKKIHLGQNSEFFELADEHHHHIVCTNCNRIEDFEDSKIEKILGRIVEHSSQFKKIKEHSLELFGLCRMCA